MEIIRSKSKILLFLCLFSFAVLLALLLINVNLSPSSSRTQNDKANMMAQMRVNVALEGARRFNNTYGRFPTNAVELFTGVQLIQPNRSILNGWTNNLGALVDPWGNELKISIDKNEFKVSADAPGHDFVSSEYLSYPEKH